MKNKHRTAPFFPAASATIEAPETDIHPVAEVLAAEAAHSHPVTHANHTSFHEDCTECRAESPMDAPQAPGTPESAAQTPADAPEPDYTLGGDVFPCYPGVGRDQNGAPPIVGLGDGTITSDGQFQPAKDDGKGFVVDMDALADEDDELDARIDAELKKIAGDGIVELPDGGVRVPVNISPEDTEIIRAWADGAGETFPDYLQTIMDMALQAVLNGGSVAG